MRNIKGLNRKEELIELSIEDGIIKSITKLDDSQKTGNEEYIIPGFIDIHTHGGYGTDFADNSEEATRLYLRKLPEEGTTAIVHTSITTPKDNLLNSIRVAKHVQDNPKEDEAKLLGVNIEGNYLNPIKKGAHLESLLQPLTKDEVDFLTQLGNIRMISHAIELSTPDTTSYIVSKGVIPSAAHTVATGEETLAHLKAGLKGATHTYNAMPQLAHREDHIINRVLTEDEIFTEVIVDGIHVSPAMIELLYKIKPLEKILIISDSAPAKGLPDGDYKFGELDIYKVGDTIRTKLDGSLAGSIANMHLCFTNFIKFTGCSIEEASIMTSTNQAKYLGLEKMGEIKEGFAADILILNKDLSIKETIVNGNTLYSK